MPTFFATLAGAAPFAAELAVKGTVWLGAILLLTFLLRGLSAATRHLVWSLGIVGLFILPLLSNRLPWRIAVPLAAAPDAHRAQRDHFGDAPFSLAVNTGTEVTRSTTTSESLGRSDAPEQTSTNPLASTPSASMSPVRIGMLLLVVWWAGALLLMLRLTRSITRVGRLLANARECDDSSLAAMVRELAYRVGVRRRVRLLIARNTTIPFTTGVGRPSIVLPAGVEDWSKEKREAVLLHELAHIARSDLWTSFAAHFACAVHWFNPLVWVAARRMRVEAERACDDAVLRCGTRASDYADQLLQVVRETQLRWAPTVAVAMARRSAFEGRLLAILSPETNRARLTPRFATPVALGVALLTLPIAAMSAGRAEQQVAGESEATQPIDTLTVPVLASEAQDAAPEAQDTLQRAGVGAIRVLTTALKDSDEGVRLAAIQALASREVRSVVPDLLPLLEDSSLEVRRAVAEALSSMPDPRAIAALVQALRSDADAGVRELAAEALGQIDDERAVPGLSAALRQERVPAVRRKIVWALAEIESPSAAAALGEALRDEDAEVRANAVWGLGSLKVRSAVPQLIPLLRDANAEVRGRVAQALGEMKSLEALDELMAAVGDANADVRQNVISALGSLETSRALPAFVRALRDDNVDVRRHAVSAISDIDGLERAPRELVEALNDADVEVRESTLHALGNIKDVSTVSAIIPLSRSGQPVAVREAAVEALAEIGGAQVESVLLELMKDPDPKIRRRAAQGLGKD